LPVIAAGNRLGRVAAKVYWQIRIDGIRRVGFVKTLFVALRSVVYASGFLFLWGWAAVSVRRFDPWLGIALPVWLRAPGFILLVFGAVAGLACVASFITRGRGTPAPFDAPREFVATGPYRYCRNPMYVGGAAMLAGFGLFAGSPSVLLLAVGMSALAHTFVVVYEEPTLRKTFGQTYVDYCRSVHRWLPRLPRS
jgi:protein-S-isoprenylcysteine O-methyltransferase Ste14